MRQKNIADFILYDLSAKNFSGDFGIGSGVISELVEGWNRNIYVLPQESIKLKRHKSKKYMLM